jgi:hypothetical protein
MTAKFSATTLAFLLSFSLGGCIGGGGGGGGEGEPDQDTNSGPTNASPLVTWSPTASTTAVPTYGKNCRYEASSVFNSPSNNTPDDSLDFTANANGAWVSVSVRDANGEVLKVIQAQLQQGLKDKSYRKASGSASWAQPQKTGDIVDGTLCFSEKLTGATNVEAEFSFVMQMADGSHESLSGTFSLAANTISVGDSIAIASTSLDISL